MTIRIDGTNTAANPGITGADADTGLQFGTDEIKVVTGGTEAITVDASQRVGIGTASPGRELEVYKDDAQAAIAITASTSGQSSLYFADTADSNIGAISYTHSDNALSFRVNDGERARIDSSGRLLVGTSTFTGTTNNSNDAYLIVEGNATDSGGDGRLFIARGAASGSTGQVLGSLAFSSANHKIAASLNAQIDTGTWTSGSSHPSRLVFSTTANGASTPTERMRIHAAGNTSLSGGISVGGLGNPGTAIVFNGTVIGAGAGTYPLKWNSSTGVVTYDTSSALLKENIIDCPYGIEKVKQLQPRKYLRIDDQREEIGFVADEVIQVMPEYVPVGPKSVITKNEDDTEEIPLGVHYDKLTAVLTKALQEAIAKIETLEAQNAQFEARLTALEGGTN